MRDRVGWLHSTAVVLGGLGLLAVLAAGYRPVVQGDGVGYYSYLHAVLVRHSLDLGPEYEAAVAAGVNTGPAVLSAPTRTGRAADYFPIGPALLSAPAYLGTLTIGGSGRPGYAPALTGSFTISSVLVGLLALVLCWRLTGSAVAVVAATLCTPYVFYLLYEPSYSHTFSAFAVSAFVWLWWRGREARSALGWLGLGVLAGAMAITRWQDAPLAAVALLTPPREGRWRMLLAIPGALLALAPQLAVDQALFGTWLPQRPPGQALDPLAGHELEVLFSSWHGLFVWHPVTLVATGGSLFVRDVRLRLACLYALAVQTLVNGSAPDWSGGAAFGARRFLDLVPFWTIGLAALAARLPSVASWSATAALAAWNALLVVDLQHVIGGGRDPGYLGLLGDQVAAVPYLPHLVAQGVVVRNLAPVGLTGLAPRPSAGLAWLAVEAACVALLGLAVLAARRRELSVP